MNNGESYYDESQDCQDDEHEDEGGHNEEDDVDDNDLTLYTLNYIHIRYSIRPL